MTRIATFQACDEVSVSAPGKFAFLGIYQTDLVIPHLPITLPQLFFIVRFRTPIEDPPKKFVVRVERSGHPPFIVDQTTTIPATFLPSRDSKFVQVQSIVRIAPFEVTETGTIKVFVVDEFGDNYAGGLRVTVGVPPELLLSQTVGVASLLCAHFKRLSEYPDNVRERAAADILNNLSDLLTLFGLPPKLQFPEKDVRIPLSQNKVLVYFPRVELPNPKIDFESSSLFESVEIKSADEFGFVAAFEPAAPNDLNFNYTVRVAATKKPIKNTSAPAQRSPKQSRKRRST